jgi:tRNA threonylcarbamoyl adenosine modification protein (Sua5/YciO/YrdC/YwlC family)
MSEYVDRDEAVRRLIDGGVVALPTDTVYGVAASLWSADALAALFRAKARPAHVPLPILVHTLNPIQEIDVEWGEYAERLADEFWPGPLTIVVPASRDLARRVGADKDSVGVRVPNDDLLLSILRDTGPLCVSSANSHGLPPCRSAAEVRDAFGEGLLAGVLDDGERRGDVSSVVVVGEGIWRVEREGAIGTERIAELLG